jgi:hypothetical protein
MAQVRFQVDSNDSIVACQQDAADFFDSIGPTLPSPAFDRNGSYRRMSCRIGQLT